LGVRTCAKPSCWSRRRHSESPGMKSARPSSR
jgi:hypothetical protein